MPWSGAQNGHLPDDLRDQSTELRAKLSHSGDRQTLGATPSAATVAAGDTGRRSGITHGLSARYMYSAMSCGCKISLRPMLP